MITGTSCLNFDSNLDSNLGPRQLVFIVCILLEAWCSSSSVTQVSRGLAIKAGPALVFIEVASL